jgi:hypothetical protein
MIKIRSSRNGFLVWCVSWYCFLVVFDFGFCLSAGLTGGVCLFLNVILCITQYYEKCEISYCVLSFPCVYYIVQRRYIVVSCNCLFMWSKDRERDEYCQERSHSWLVNDVGVCMSFHFSFCFSVSHLGMYANINLWYGGNFPIKRG